LVCFYDIEKLFTFQVAPKAKDKGDKKGGVSNGNAGAPLPPIGDNKAKEEANMYKKQAAESDRKLVYFT
jgi:hypothetical protein